MLINSSWSVFVLLCIGCYCWVDISFWSSSAICELLQLWADPLAAEPCLAFSRSISSWVFLTRELNWLFRLSSFAFNIRFVYSALSNMSLNFFYLVVYTWPELYWDWLWPLLSAASISCDIELLSRMSADYYSGFPSTIRLRSVSPLISMWLFYWVCVSWLA